MPTICLLPHQPDLCRFGHALEHSLRHSRGGATPSLTVTMSPPPGPPLRYSAASAAAACMSPRRPVSPLPLPQPVQRGAAVAAQAASPPLAVPFPATHGETRTARPQPQELGDLSDELCELEAEIASATACIESSSFTPRGPLASGQLCRSGCLSIMHELTCMAEDTMAVVSGGGTSARPPCESHGGSSLPLLSYARVRVAATTASAATHGCPKKNVVVSMIAIVSVRSDPRCS